VLAKHDDPVHVLDVLVELGGEHDDPDSRLRETLGQRNDGWYDVC
jgi:hypothetical protein